MKRLIWLAAVGLLVAGVGWSIAQTEPECPRPAVSGDTAAYLIGQGQVHYAGGDFPAAVLDYTCAINLTPDYAPAYVNRGYAYAALGDSEKALADYNKAIELDETLATAYTNRGALYTRLGIFGLAINDFTLALGLNPGDVVAYNNRGVVHAIEGNYDLAIADLEQAIQIEPNFAAPYASLGAVYSAMAARNYQQFVKVSGDPKAKLPGGTPDEVLAALDDSLRTGNFSAWLSLLAPAE